MSSNTENTMNMDIPTQMVAFIENHGGLDLGEFYKWFEGSSPEEIIRTYNSMLLAKYNKEIRGKLEKIDVEKDVSSIKEQLVSLPSGETLYETIGGLSQVKKDMSSIKEQLNSIPKTVSGLSEEEEEELRELLNSIPSVETLHETIGGLSEVEKWVMHAMIRRDQMEEDVSSIKKKLNSIPSVETLQTTVMECKDLKDTIKEMYKTMDVIMNENRRLSSLIEKQSNVSNAQLEWAEITVCCHDLCEFIKKEWVGKQLTIGHLKYICRGEHGHDFSVAMAKFNDDRHTASKLGMDEFLLSIERLFKINIPSIYDDVHLHFKIHDTTVTTDRDGTTHPLLDIPDQTVGAWLKEIKEFPGKLRANPDSYFLIKRKEIIPPVIFHIISFMVGSKNHERQCQSWKDQKQVPLGVEANKRNLAWQRDLVKGSSQSI